MLEAWLWCFLEGLDWIGLDWIGLGWLIKVGRTIGSIVDDPVDPVLELV